MALKKFVKDPNARLDYTVDWSSWLEPDSDTIDSATVIGSSGITVELASWTATQTKAWVSGGEAGNSYDVTFRVTTAGGRTDDRTITINCKEL